jgi:membrane protease YdiL (CAAX protease family)
VSTGVYTLVIAFSGGIALTLAAAGLGLLLGLQRRATGGVLAPMLTHLTWTVVTLPALTRILPG